MISCNIWLPVVIHRSKTRNNALNVFWDMETIIVNLAFSWVLVKLQFQLMKVKNISPKLSARANYTFSGMTILQHEPAAAPKKVFLPCVSLPRANFYENIFYNAFALQEIIDPGTGQTHVKTFLIKLQKVWNFKGGTWWSLLLFILKHLFVKTFAMESCVCAVSFVWGF